MAEQTQKAQGRQPRKQNREAKGRKKRIPMGGSRSRLEVQGKDPNYVYRWFNDQGGRLAQAQQADYQFVTSDENVTVGAAEDLNTDEGSYVSQIVGKTEDGKPMRAYLMKIKREFYEEDQATKQEQVDEMDAAIEGGAIRGQPGQDGRYVPKSGITYDK